MIKSIIFDMGGVLILNEIKQVYLKLAKLLRIDENTLVGLIHTNRQKFMDGSYSAEDFSLLIKEKFRLQSITVEDILNKWKTAFSEQRIVNFELYNIIGRLKKNYTVGLITDAPELHAMLNREKGLYEPFDAVIISSEVGLVKPQKGIFELALKKLKSKPEECVFVDDNEKNILVARGIGFKTLHFIDNNQFVSELKLLGIKF